MHAVLTTIGTDGDVFPYLALGSALRARGHRVTLLTSSGYEALARERGLEFGSLATQAEMAEWFSHPDFWHPTKCALTAARWGTRYIERQYQVIRPFADDPDSVFVSSPAIFAARLVQEKFDRPLVTIILQPWVIPSNTAPPVLPLFTLPAGLPSFIGNTFWRMIDTISDWLLAGAINEVRTKVGLPRIRRVVRWWFSPQRIIGLFPEWYGPPQRDWLEQIRLTGFPIDDGRRQAALPEDLQRFCTEDAPPLAFTFGTEMQVAATLFAAGKEACRLLNRRGLFLTRHPQQLPQPLSPELRHVEYAPFAQLFPLCGAVIHHGGIGTTARCLQAGVPQLITPFAFDQPDNGVRVQRLGVGNVLPRHHWTGRRLATALERLLAPAMKERCHSVSTQVTTDGIEQAVRELEQFAASLL